MRSVASPFSRWLITFTFFFNAGPLAASFAEVGHLYIENFAPEDYDAHAQNWAIVQAPDGLLYVANGDGILQYDSVSWSLIPVSNQSVVRSLAVNREGQIFVGASGELGYLTLGATGQMRYVSLLEYIPPDDQDFTDVWRIVENSEGLYFLTRQKLFRWNGHEMKIWPIETRLFEIFVLGDILYAQLADFGLMRMTEETLSIAPGGELFQNRIYGVVPQGDAAYLAITREGLFRCTTRSSPKETCNLVNPGLTDLLDTLRAFDTAQLPNGKLAIATTRGGVILLDEAGKLLRILNEASGLRDEAVKAAYADKQGGLWLAFNNGLARIETGAPVSYYGKSLGLPGTVSAVERHGGHIYTASYQGISKLELASEAGTPPRFVSLAGFSRQCWTLLATPRSLLAGCSNGLYDVETQQLVATFGSVIWDIVQPKRDPTVLYLGLSTGVAKMRRHDGRWIDEGRVTEVRETVRSIAEDDQGRLWFGTRSEGVVLYDPAQTGEEAVRHFGTAEGLPPGRVEVQHIAGRMAFVSPTGLFRLIGADRFEPDTTFDEFLPSQMKRQFRLHEDTGGRVWVVINEASTIVHFQQDGSHTWVPSVLRRAPMRDVYSTFFEPDGTLWVGGPHGLVRLDTNHPFNPSTRYPVSIRRITTRDEPLLFAGQRDEPPVWPYENNALRFTFAAPRYAAPDRTLYRTRLQGLDHKWSTWSTQTEETYTNLWEGRYVFHIEARDVYGAVSQEGTFAFEILPPWYRTWWAYGLYGLTLTAVLFVYARSHRRAIRRERKIAERERSANRRLREADRLKDEFLANTSHELRTPLYGITGLAESLIDGAAGGISQPVRANLAMIVASGRRLSHLVNDILDFSKLRHKSLELDRRAVELHALVDVVLTLSESLPGAKELRLGNLVSPGLPAVYADENRLQQILYNLLGNAIKFTEDGSVTVSASTEDEMIIVRVQDTGIGISQAHQERIFTAFEQADASVEREYGGTGLGLAVTRRLVELHGGKIWVESDPEVGATFFFSLPIARDASPASTISTPSSDLQTVVSPEELALRPESTAPSESQGESVRILVVDDEPVNRQVISNYLALEDFDLITAANGEQALRLLAEQQFDLVLLDVMMPKISGYEVCRDLRRHHSMEELPVLFLTAKNQSEDVVTGLSLGANDYLSKPIAKNELLARMRPHLDLLRVHRNLENLVAKKMSEIKVLEGLLPICASCKRIRDEDGNWGDLETYIDVHSEAEFSHGTCPQCALEIYGYKVSSP